jgi:hypothetical protein
MPKVVAQKIINNKLSLHGDVQDALKAEAMRIKGRAEALLAAHRKTGSHTIEYERIKGAKYGHIDHYVSLKGPAAVSLEYGHKSRSGKKYIHGLRIMAKAML